MTYSQNVIGNGFTELFIKNSEHYSHLTEIEMLY